jgi:hypothetical protein
MCKTVCVSRGVTEGEAARIRHEANLAKYEKIIRATVAT